MSGALSQGPGGGIIPPGSAPTSPMMAGMANRYAQMPTEQLQEYAARLGGTPQGALIQRVLQQRQMMPPQQAQANAPMPQQAPRPAPGPQNQLQQGSGIVQTPQATGAGISLPPTTAAMRRGGEVQRDHMDIGGVPLSTGDPWWTRSEARGADSGMIHAYSPGRTDTVNMEPLAGSYVIPADVISGLGEGNSLAGARVMDEVIRSGPFGTPAPREQHGRGPPNPPRSGAWGESRGGRAQGAPGNRVPIVAAGGEYMVHPDDVARIGGGNLKHGHDVLDAFVKHVRAKTVKTLRKLPGPKKD
jgi:hypothetical protein